MSEEIKKNNEPPFKFKRNEYGLLTHVDYVFNEDGTVNWRKMVSPEYLSVNKDRFKGRDVPQSIDGLEDKDLIILLGGIKQLALIRGFTSVEHELKYVAYNHIGVTSTIQWIPNYETNNNIVTFQACASATLLNAPKMAPYLETIAENRGFVRAVRNFLRINIVSQEELGGEIKEEETSGENHRTLKGTPYESLDKLLSTNKITFDAFTNRMAQAEVEGASEWTKITDIPLDLVITCTEKVQARIAEKLAKKASK